LALSILVILLGFARQQDIEGQLPQYCGFILM
jgi:hypothetical protein